MSSHSDSEFSSGPHFDFDFDELLTVHPPELNIPCYGEVDFSEEHLSCTFQLTNKTDRIVAYKIRHPLRILLAPSDEYVGTILPRSTSSVTVKVGKKPPMWYKPSPLKEWIYIWAYVVMDGVKAEDITCREDFYNYLTDKKPAGFFRMPVVYYYTVPAANSSSAVVLKEYEKRISLLDEDNNPFQPSNNKEMKRVENSPLPTELVILTTGGYGSTSRRKSEDTRVKPSFKAFSPKEIQDATSNFSESLMIGHGGYGKVYKCQLDNWDVAVKILDHQGDQGLKEYIKEMEVLEGMKHENIIHLMGTCFKFCALIYEHLPNGSLEDSLKYRPEELTWEIRTRIVYEICTVLRFLHANEPEPLVHGDIKPANVLLDAKFKVKLADFGLCRYLTQGKNSKAFRLTTHASGSDGYMDPDYMATLKVNAAIDVYSFGKTIVKILTGKYPPDIFREVYEAKKRRSLMDIVDPAVRRWPENIVGILGRFALKASTPDRYRSEFMGNFYSELEKILDGIVNCTTTAI